MVGARGHQEGEDRHKKEIVPNEKILEHAVRFGLTSVMEEHIGTGANEVRKKDRATRVLLKACSVGNIEILQLALAWGAEIEAVERRETTEPRAKEFGRKPIVHKSKDQAALLIATEWGWNDVTQIFLSHGAMSTARDASGLDALQTAVNSTRVFEERLSLIATRG